MPVLGWTWSECELSKITLIVLRGVLLAWSSRFFRPRWMQADVHLHPAAHQEA